MEYINQEFSGERSLFKQKDINVTHCKFNFGESPLKEGRNIKVQNSVFTYKYPLWYCKNVYVTSTQFIDQAKSGIWYTEDITVSDVTFDVVKMFRRCNRVNISNTKFTKAEETLWSCKNVELENVEINGDYFGMNSSNIRANNITINGNYCFDGAENIKITNSTLNSKDAFWNCQNVVLINCTIIGEYLAWNTDNIQLINCRIESNQGLCYTTNLSLKDCIFANTDLAFEYSSFKGNATGHILSIKNPYECDFTCENVDEIIIDDNFIKKGKIKIVQTERGETYEI